MALLSSSNLPKLSLGIPGGTTGYKHDKQSGHHIGTVHVGMRIE